MIGLSKSAFFVKLKVIAIICLWTVLFEQLPFSAFCLFCLFVFLSFVFSAFCLFSLLSFLPFVLSAFCLFCLCPFCLFYFLPFGFSAFCTFGLFIWFSFVSSAFWFFCLNFLTFLQLLKKKNVYALFHEINLTLLTFCNKEPILMTIFRDYCLKFEIIYFQQILILYTITSMPASQI